MLHIGNLNERLKDVWAEPVGIVEDFHNESLRQPLGATFILAETKPYYEGMLIRVKAGSEKQVLASIGKAWKIIVPSKLLEAN